MQSAYEAVLQVQPQRHPLEQSQPAEARDALPYQPVMTQEMTDMHLNLESILADNPHKVVQFMSSQHGEGVSTIVREYAWLTAANLGQRVLIVDANRPPGGQKDFFGINNSNGWEDAAQDLVPTYSAMTRIGPTLFVSGYSSRHESRMPISDATKLKVFVELVRNDFDCVVIDSIPAVTTGAVSITGCSDGVILVIEAEKTRWPVVQSVKNRLITNNCRVLGMVINKKRDYIPPFIYSRLK